jgi:pyrroloquinoline quinone (PQQ) biosynthesis protein C
MALSIEEFERQVQQDMRLPDHNLPDHPTVLAMEAGRLTRDELRAGATQVYAFLKEHARVFGLAYGRCPDPEVRPHILRVLVEETLGIYSNSGPHLPHLVRFCEALGVDHVEQAARNPTTEAAIEWWIAFAGERPWLEAWGTWGFSNRRPAFGRVYEALKTKYGIGEDALFFWKLHAAPASTPDERAQELAAVGKHLRSEEAQRKVRDASLEMSRHWMALWRDALHR